jgi:AcrR family transcriptional regulator
MAGTRERIIEAAATLLTAGGRDAVSTRAVGSAAGVQAPTIYRLFGDKQGLLDAVASHAFATYVRDKSDLAKTDDPVDDLRRGWDLHISFGLANPAFYALMYGEPSAGGDRPAAREAAAILSALVHRIAEAGRLGVSEERAAHLVHAAGSGMTFTLISLPPEQRDPALSILARESVLSAISTDAPARAGNGVVGTAVALRAALPEVTVLTEPERGLLAAWLDRIAGTA